MAVKLLKISENAMYMLENIACTCYRSKPTEDFKITKNCFESGHLSIGEHEDITFEVECSRACSHQIVRHRTGKFTQQSQRYVNENEFGFVIPQSIKDKEMTKEYCELMQDINQMYNVLISTGVPKEDARFVLPNACKTKIIITFDFRNFFHFLNERLCTRSQWEIRGIAKDMAKLAIEACPAIERWCVPKCELHSISFCPEKKGCGRHKSLKELVNK